MNNLTSEKKKRLKPLPYYLTKPLSRKVRAGFIKYLVYKKCGSYIIDIPDDLAAVKNILFVLPEDTLEALHQIVNILSIINHFNKTHKVHAFFLCEQRIAPYFNNFQGANSVIEYDVSERYLFSNHFSLLRKKLVKEYIDLCLFLERDPDLSLLYLVGQIQAKIRISYSDVGSFPFFNLQIKSTDRHTHLTEQNNIMSRILGAKLSNDIQWSVSKDTISEIKVMLKESSIPETDWLGGVDAQLFYYKYGMKWMDNLIENLTAQSNKRWYLYIRDIPEDSFFDWLKSKKIPVFSALSPPRLAALLKKTDLIISGKSETFELANLLQTTAIGLFEKNELQKYCKSTPISIGIPYSIKPDEQTIKSIIDRITSLAAQKDTI